MRSINHDGTPDKRGVPSHVLEVTENGLETNTASYRGRTRQCPSRQGHGVDELRWNMLDELTTFTYFGIETLLACCLKVMIVERWEHLDETSGKEKLNRLIEELESGFQLSKEFD